MKAACCRTTKWTPSLARCSARRAMPVSLKPTSANDDKWPAAGVSKILRSAQRIQSELFDFFRSANGSLPVRYR